MQKGEIDLVQRTLEHMEARNATSRPMSVNPATRLRHWEAMVSTDQVVMKMIEHEQ